MTSFQINWRSVDLAMTEYVTSDYHKKHTKKYVSMNLLKFSMWLNHLFRRINFSILGHGMWFLKNGEKFSSQFYGEYFDLTECNVLFDNEHLILICFFLLIDTEFDLKIIFRILNPEKYIYENPQNVVFKSDFSII